MREPSEIEEALEALEELIRRYPNVGSAVLIAAAVEWDIVAEDRADLMAQTLDLTDFERVRAVLSAEVDRRGRRTELVGLIRTGVRVRRRASILLRRSSGGRSRFRRSRR